MASSTTSPLSTSSATSRWLTAWTTLAAVRGVDPSGFGAQHRHQPRPVGVPFRRLKVARCLPQRGQVAGGRVDQVQPVGADMGGKPGAIDDQSK